MTESVFETVEKSCQILKLDFSSEELAILAQEQELTPEQKSPLWKMLQKNCRFLWAVWSAMIW